jgi:hypothetical protein
VIGIAGDDRPRIARRRRVLGRLRADRGATFELGLGNRQYSA